MFSLWPTPSGTWLLIETETGEVVDEFQDERLARQTLHEQLTA